MSRLADVRVMSTAPLREVMTLSEVRAEMDRISERTLARGAFHPAEYWRMKELARIEQSLRDFPGLW